MSVLVDVAGFRAWAGAAAASVSDELVAQCLDEAEAGLCADLDVTVDQLTAPVAEPLAVGEVKRRASRLLARRNSPEALSGFGEAIIAIPVRDPDSARTEQAIRAVLQLRAVAG